MGSLEGMISLGPWGGSKGDHWSFKASRGITEIIIHEEVNIKSISFKDASGHISGTFGGRNLDGKGEEKKIEIHWPSEYLKSISGIYGDYDGLLVIRSLSFITNLTTYGPFGTTSGGEPFSIPIADSVVVGFHGRADFYLDALGIFVQPVHSHGRISFGQWGGLGGDPFSFRVESWIKEIIVVHARTNIKSITFKDADGHEYGKFGGNNPNDTDVKTTIEIDGHLEHLTSITGTYGNHNGITVITSLSFITNLTAHGPFGSANRTSFSLPMEGSLVNGFHGRGGHDLDAIGIHVKPRDVEGPRGCPCVDPRDIASIIIGPWGCEGGDFWSYTANRGINQIIIHARSNIKCISFRDVTGLYSETFGGTNPSDSDSGERQIVNINWPSEHLRSISGSYSYFDGLLSLTFTTNLDTYGPFGASFSTNPFSIPISYATVFGFFGRADRYLNSIGIHVKPMNIEGLGEGQYVDPRDIGSISLGPWGAESWVPWSYTINQGIDQIIIREGEGTNIIRFISFRDVTGLESPTFGGGNSINDTSATKIVNINWPSEHLISISGTYGLYNFFWAIRSLSFRTNLATYGPFGTTSGTSFSIPISNHTVVGLHGWGNRCLEGIGIVVKPVIKPQSNF